MVLAKLGCLGTRWDYVEGTLLETNSLKFGNYLVYNVLGSSLTVLPWIFNGEIFWISVTSFETETKQWHISLNYIHVFLRIFLKKMEAG